jgi:erythromycin esterase-like protein
MYPFTMQQDSTQTIHGKNPLCLAPFKIGRIYNLLNGKIEQTLLLPETKIDSAIVSLNCKSLNLQQAQLIISGIDDQERISYSDTLALLCTEKWSTFIKGVSVHDVKFLHFSIEAKGISNKTKQCLYLDKLDIKLDGKDINTFPLPTIPIIPDIKKSDIISLSFSNDNALTKISALKSKKIVAIGETIHGSETITEAAAQIIKYQVEHNNCKLILLEIPTEQTLLWNRFIQGDSLISNENIIQELSRFLFSPRIMFSLLNWLKQYNAKAKEPVWLFGIDLSLSSRISEIYFYDYIYRIKEKQQHVLLDSLCSKLYDYKSFPQALQILDDNKEIEKLLGEKEYQILRHFLSLSITAGDNPFKRSSIRDNHMFLNASFLLDLLCSGDEKAVIYEHFFHVNYKNVDPSFPFHNSFGSYMKNKFGNSYYSIAVLAGEGNFRTSFKDSISLKKALQAPPKNSLEDLFMRTNEAFCFLPITELPPKLTYFRVMGNSYLEDQFSILAPNNRMDAAIFVRYNKTFDIVKGYITYKHEYNMYLLKQLQINNERYQKKKVFSK